MNIQAIRLFLHVMQRGSLAAGAQVLNMSPSAASRLLSGLERTTGLTLFSRDGHSLRPTPEGAQYFHECQRVLIAVDELPHAARRLATGARPRLKVASGARLATSLMIPAIGRFAKKHPEVEIDFQLAQALEFARMLSDPPDVAVGALLSMKAVAVDAAPLFDMPTVAVMRRDHALAGRAFVRTTDLAAHRIVATPVGPMRDELEHLFLSEGSDFHPHYTANSLEHCCALLLQTGALMITDPLVPLAMNPEQFALVPLKPLRRIQTSVFTFSLTPNPGLTTEFKACLQEEVQAISKRVALLLGKASRRSKRQARF